MRWALPFTPLGMERGWGGFGPAAEGENFLSYRTRSETKNSITSPGSKAS